MAAPKLSRTTVLYAAYGSNLHPSRMRKRIPSAELLGAACVTELQLCFHKRGKDGSGKCSIVEGPGETHFAVFEFERRDKQRLDQIERLGNGYDQLHIDLPNFGLCYTYIASDSHIDNRLAPFTWYKALVLAGCQYHRFPQKYIQDIAAVPDQLDADSNRHRHNLDIVEN